MKTKFLLVTSITSFLLATISYGPTCHQLSLATVNNYYSSVNSVNDVLSSKPLFNNEYDLLQNSASESHNNWITNQSVADHKFYSYDTSALANYTFPEARKAFIVDNNGKLVANPQVMIPETDKLNIANTQQEMISGCHVTTIKDDYDPYSNSNYNNSFFSGDDSDWKYLQLGSYAPNIDISQQNGGQNVTNSDKLNESLAFYYIAQALNKTADSISWEVAKNLTHYVIDNSSVNDKASVKTLADDLIPLIANNSTIYEYIRTSPVQLNDHSFSFNYILDSKDNLIAIYYNKFKINNKNVAINYKYEQLFYGMNASKFFNYDFFKNTGEGVTTVPAKLRWKDYARDWASFVNIYPQISFDDSSLINIYMLQQFNSKNTGKDMILGTKDIDIKKPSTAKFNISQPFFKLLYTTNTTVPNPGLVAEIEVLIWHDDENIYFNLGGMFFSSQMDGDLHYLLQLNTCILHSFLA